MTKMFKNEAFCFLICHFDFLSLIFAFVQDFPAGVSLPVALPPDFVVARQPTDDEAIS